MNFLRPFLAAWLTLQFLMPLVPTWGLFLPHGHIASGRVTARDWQAHGENHRLPQTQKPVGPGVRISAVATNDGLSSLFSSTDLSTPSALSWISRINDFCEYRVRDCFYARAVDLPVIIPPPKPHADTHTLQSNNI